MTQPTLFSAGPAPARRRGRRRPAVHPGRAGQAAAAAGAHPRSRPRSSPRRWSRCWWSPAPAPARPRRWPPGWSGWSPTAYVRPEQILGLTFTRKAAGELAHRIRTRLGQLIRRLGRQGRDPLDDPLAGEPTVSTYHSYAGPDRHRARAARRVRAVHPAAHRGVPLAARRPAGAQLRRRHVRGGPGAEHGHRRGAGARRRAGRAPGRRRTSWPPGPAGSSPRCRPGPAGSTPTCAKALALQQTRLQPAAAGAARTTGARRTSRRWTSATSWPGRPGWPATIPRSARSSGTASGWCCSTSTRTPATPRWCCCNALFGGGHPVTAVGDPCQSIYGWRGASAGTLDRFPAEFTRAGGATGRGARR